MNTPLKVRKLLRTISLASLRATVGFNAHTTPHTLHNYHSGYTPFHGNYTTPDKTYQYLPNDNRSETSSEDSIAQEDRRFRRSYYVVLDALRHIRYLLVKTPLELSREVRAHYDELDTPILVTSSHNSEYTPRTVYQPPDPGYIRVSMCCLKGGRIQELGLYDDIPVYCGGRLPHGRVHFALTRELWQLPNIAVIDPAAYMMYQIREPLSLALDELGPFIQREYCLPMIDVPSPGLAKVRLIRLYSKRKVREWRAFRARISEKLANSACVHKQDRDFQPWLL